MPIQTITYAAAITPNISLGESIEVTTLTGNLQINNVTNVVVGSRFRYLLRTDGTARSLTWGANYRVAVDSLNVISANSRVIIEFFPLTSTVWIQDNTTVETAI